MGSKAAVVAFGQAGRWPVFTDSVVVDEPGSRQLARTVLEPDAVATGSIGLDLAVWPEAGISCVAKLYAHEIFSSRELAIYRPSELADWVGRIADARAAAAVFMHSAEDWAAFAIWGGGELIRSLRMNAEHGIIEDVGDRRAFEAPFWDGEKPLQGSETTAFRSIR
ncbi:DUF6928 family protein [Kribbella sandramycini]|uniref:Uncharacterized protein n=1 Tax=Kribbella sandramycini TaxID=60450 RepID=A0A841SN33_9ACTN|nr:hypothetical protein [Kribbella sandramycini]MBB6570715.1 hypothetical protein [Kribbella sandramycini]